VNSDSPVIAVTGAAGALGSAVVAHLAERGSRVAAIDQPGASAALTALGECHAGRCVPVLADVASLASWPATLSNIERDLAPPTGAVLCAGGWRGGMPLWEEDGDVTWRSMLDMNLETARAALHALLPGMVGRGRGSIVLVGSRAAERPWESARAAAYATAKAAVVALGQAVAAEARDSGVRINIVLPSVIDTPANRRDMPDADFSRWVTTLSLAEVIGFLLSDAARDVSGAAIPVYGKA
jgi:NAD(P)-dependent dehydrogenase (short-subunit alcohol dehydrogenase family)